MGRQSTFSTLLDYCMTISISDLQRLGMVQPGMSVMATIVWTKKGEKTRSIRLAVVMQPKGTQYAEFIYTYGETFTRYKISLVSMPSNLGRGDMVLFMSSHWKALPETLPRAGIISSQDSS